MSRRKQDTNKDLSREVVIFFLELFHIRVSDSVKDLLVQIFKFGIVGVIATIIDFIFLYIFRDFCNFHLLVSTSLSFSISVVYNYFASRTFVFDIDTSKDNKSMFVKFIILSVIGLGINNILMELFTNVIGIYYLISKVISTLFVMIFNFITRKKFME